VLATLFDETGRPRVELLAPRSLPTPADMAEAHRAIYAEIARPRSHRRALPADASNLNGLRSMWRSLRQTNFYRELALRRVLTEPARGKIEAIFSAMFERLGR
jgi:hypothetical protein